VVIIEKEILLNEDELSTVLMIKIIGEVVLDALMKDPSRGAVFGKTLNRLHNMILTPHISTATR